jgi:hypothetical protein
VGENVDNFKIVWYKSSDGHPHKRLISDNYNYDFDAINGNFNRWGTTIEDDPQRSPYGPEIADIEIVKGCMGVKGKLCPECYKSNDKKRIKYMTQEEFIRVFEKIDVNHTITQVALGLDAGAELNPELWKICSYLRHNLVIPNGTVADISDKTADMINHYFGACAVSLHQYDKTNTGWEAFYETIGKLSERMETDPKYLKQLNCHVVAAEETYETILELFHRKKTDPYLKRLNAIVLLGLKKCGRGVSGFTRMSDEHFKTLVDTAMDYEIGVGFDSCSGNRFDSVIKDRPDYKEIAQLIEPCESGLFSSYLNEEGVYYHCSFCENLGNGVRVIDVDNFVNDVWNKDQSWIDRLLASKRSCPEYEV